MKETTKQLYLRLKQKGADYENETDSIEASLKQQITRYYLIAASCLVLSAAVILGLTLSQI